MKRAASSQGSSRNGRNNNFPEIFGGDFFSYLLNSFSCYILPLNFPVCHHCSHEKSLQGQQCQAFYKTGLTCKLVRLQLSFAHQGPGQYRWGEAEDTMVLLLLHFAGEPPHHTSTHHHLPPLLHSCLSRGLERPERKQKGTRGHLSLNITLHWGKTDDISVVSTAPISPAASCPLWGACVFPWAQVCGFSKAAPT